MLMIEMTDEQKELEAAFEKDSAGAYEDFVPLPEGGTSYVWLIKRVGIPHRRVLKVLKPTLQAIAVQPVGGHVLHRTFQALFAAESARILELQHPNIIKLFDANVLQTPRGPVSWYAMEYVDGACDLDKYLKRRREERSLSEDDVMRVIRQAAEGLAACHTANVIHADIKPGNIMAGTDGSVRLVDFGFAKSVRQVDAEKQDLHSVWISDKRYMHPELLRMLDDQQKAAPELAADDERTMWLAIPREQLRERGKYYDLYALGRTLEECWRIAGLGAVVKTNGDFVRRMWERLQAAGSDHAVRYETALELVADLEKVARGYSPESVMAELNAFPADSIRVPSRGRIPLTDRLAWLIDRTWFQRLRGTRQLGPVHLVYPGACHSRFEHSLGVFEKAAYYVRSLWGATDHQYFKQSAGEKDVAALLVAALLHDVGHYPFAHAFEEVEPNRQRLMKHAMLSSEIIRGRLPNLVSASDSSEFQEHLWKDWGIEPDDVAAVLNTAVKPKNLQSHLVPCLHSVIDGPLDADKLDYLVRDGHHCGSPYGSAIDEEKFLQSLIAPGANQPIGIWEKGLVAAEAAYLARYHMFVTVYWHHMTRACERMASEAVRVLRQSNPEAFDDLFLNRIFRMGDDGFLEELARLLGGDLASDLVYPLLPTSGARVRHYRRLLTLAYGPLDPPSRPQETTIYERIREMFDQYMTGDAEAGRAYRLFEAKLRGEIVRLIGGAGRAHHVLLDVPDPRIETPQGFFVYRDEGGDSRGDRNPSREPVRQPITDRSTLHTNFLQDWKRHARRIRIYVCPTVGGIDVREHLKDRRAAIMKHVEELAQELHSRRETILEKEVKAAWDELKVVEPAPLLR
jgi:HD superfamily phosphohydrolase/serine/threonine protein kinase